jgi:hypothetical protein
MMIKGIQLENINSNMVSPHPNAMCAFEFTRKLQYQVDGSFLKPTLLGQGTFELPLVVYDGNGRYQFFAGWKYLLSPFNLGLSGQSILALVFSSRKISKLIEFTAWQYAFQLSVSNLQEKTYLASTSMLIQECPFVDDILNLLKAEKNPTKAHLLAEKLYSVGRRRAARQEAYLSSNTSLEVNNGID